MVDIEKLADEAEVIVQGYAFFRKGDGIHIIDLHRPTNYAHFSKDELVKTLMDDFGKGFSDADRIARTELCYV